MASARAHSPEYPFPVPLSRPVRSRQTTDTSRSHIDLAVSNDQGAGRYRCHDIVPGCSYETFDLNAYHHHVATKHTHDSSDVAMDNVPGPSTSSASSQSGRNRVPRSENTENQGENAAPSSFSKQNLNLPEKETAHFSMEELKCAICQFCASSGPELQMHYNVQHNDYSESKPSSKSRALPKPVKLVRSKAPHENVASTSAADPVRAQDITAIEQTRSVDGAADEDSMDDSPVPIKRKREESKDKDLDYHPDRPCSSDSVFPRRYPTRNKESTNLAASLKHELSERLHKVLFEQVLSDSSEDSMETDDGNLDDPMRMLRVIAPILTDQVLEAFAYDEKKQLGDGYSSIFMGRLQSVVDDSQEGNYILHAVGEALDRMNSGFIEYQKPDDSLLEHINDTLERAQERPILRLCSYVEFYGKDLGDSGWGCGYRNAQMLISSLLKWPAVKACLVGELEGDYIPSIRRLQTLIHRAWSRGFDLFAATELNHKVRDTSKWIGTTEIQALFHSMRIECLIKDFGSVIGAIDVQDQLFTFVQEYFATQESKGFVAPMYIQYSGHSRTIIGLETTGCAGEKKKPKEKVKGKNTKEKASGDSCLHNTDKLGLLILDPGETPADLAVTGASATRKWYKDHIFHPIKSFKEETYQILFFTGHILSNEDYERMKQPGEGHHSNHFREYS